ncbi:MAG: tRNA (adenosine(37)-N6)-threonylcarbamoyltransferase complex ATPase subunit type 1 TsaE [Parcubacteria group bacterium]|nr:tRNA (adenosine(37)-N6)-threonylcarbamoyltransferase complex ATPase subunit type 1 TsaE [Parcubacteria group bacterium]
MIQPTNIKKSDFQPTTKRQYLGSRTSHTQSDSETRQIAEEFARELLSETNACHVVSLEGELGAGKTTFMQGVGRGLGIRQQMTSPTFIIFCVFDLKKCAYKRLYHFDCYRLKSYEDLRALEFEDIIADPKNLVIIEWGDMIKEHLPKNTIQITFEVVSRDTRSIKIVSGI